MDENMPVQHAPSEQIEPSMAHPSSSELDEQSDQSSPEVSNSEAVEQDQSEGLEHSTPEGSNVGQYDNPVEPAAAPSDLEQSTGAGSVTQPAETESTSGHDNTSTGDKPFEDGRLNPDTEVSLIELARKQELAMDQEKAKELESLSPHALSKLAYEALARRDYPAATAYANIFAMKNTLLAMDAESSSASDINP
jgi:hypothetical protein